MHKRKSIQLQSCYFTAPGPQTSDILKNSKIETPKIKNYLDNISYEKSLSIMLRLTKPSNIPKPGGLKMDHDIKLDL